MQRDEFKKRTKAYGLRVIRLVESLSNDMVSSVLDRQLLRSATSVGANYRSACRARSKADFIAKLGVVEEECDESLFWMEMLVDANKLRPSKVIALQKEGDEILAMVVASINTSRKGTRSAIRNPQPAID
jgi:four helix bundle protein